MRFRPSISLTLLLALLIVLFGWLGSWQLERMEEKKMLLEQFEQAPLLPVSQAFSGDRPFTRVQAQGRFDSQHHILRDNRILNGRVGVHVYTPFELVDGSSLLVNRGWLPLPADRSSLPEVPTPDEAILISGILREPAKPGPRLGKPDTLDSGDWPQLVTYMDLDTIADALGTGLSPWIMQLDEDDPTGFDGRQWQPAVMKPATHGAYALQWFSLSVTAFIIWLVLGVRRGSALRKRAAQ